MENYIKAILYAYPQLKRSERDYEEHIRNKAVMSYDYRVTTERMAEYLAGEILKKERIERLSRTVENVLRELTVEERFLLEVRYFRRKSQLKKYGEEISEKLGSIRSYYRKQGKVLKKASILFRRSGMTEENFLREYSQFGYLMSVYRYIEEGREGAGLRERALVVFLENGGAGDRKKRRPRTSVKADRVSGIRCAKERGQTD